MLADTPVELLADALPSLSPTAYQPRALSPPPIYGKSAHLPLRAVSKSSPASPIPSRNLGVPTPSPGDAAHPRSPIVSLLHPFPHHQSPSSPTSPASPGSTNLLRNFSLSSPPGPWILFRLTGVSFPAEPERAPRPQCPLSGPGVGRGVLIQSLPPSLLQFRLLFFLQRPSFSLSLSASLAGRRIIFFLSSSIAFDLLLYRCVLFPPSTSAITTLFPSNPWVKNGLQKNTIGQPRPMVG